MKERRERNVRKKNKRFDGRDRHQKKRTKPSPRAGAIKPSSRPKPMLGTPEQVVHLRFLGDAAGGGGSTKGGGASSSIRARCGLRFRPRWGRSSLPLGGSPLRSPCEEDNLILVGRMKCRSASRQPERGKSARTASGSRKEKKKVKPKKNFRAGKNCSGRKGSRPLLFSLSLFSVLSHLHLSVLFLACFKFLVLMVLWFLHS